MTLIRKCIAENESKLSRLLDLFLEGEFDREVLLKRKMELEKQLADLKYEQMSLQEHLDSVIMSDDVIASIEAICAEISIELITQPLRPQYVIDRLDEHKYCV